MTDDELKKFTDSLHELTDLQLKELAEKVSDMYSKRRAWRAEVARNCFWHGQKVWFLDKFKNKKVGFITKMNPAKAKVKVDGITWTVPYSLLNA